MSGGPSSSATKRDVLRTLLIDGCQMAKVVVDPTRIGNDLDHGFPARIIATYPDGIPLDLNPVWPLDLDLDSDPERMSVSLSFGGQVCRCSVPWRAISMIAVGVGGVSWQHESDVATPEAQGPSPLPIDHPRKAKERASHLRVLK